MGQTSSSCLDVWVSISRSSIIIITIMFVAWNTIGRPWIRHFKLTNEKLSYFDANTPH
jgi:hypothetical protein